MSRVAGLTITASALFLLVVAVKLQSAALFYMCSAMILTIAACRVQAWLAIRGLRFERWAPPTARQGEWVQVDINVASEIRVRRPLILIQDRIPSRLGATDRTPSLPVAPAYDHPVRTQYRFRANRRGRFRWSGLTVTGTDALGLVTMARDYETEPSELLVLPTPIPISLGLPLGEGWGHNEAADGRIRGPGLEPYGIREYAPGDSLRHVHWRSSARTGQLLVREFETGSNAKVAIVFQRARGTDLGDHLDKSTLDLACGHAAFLAERYLREGAQVSLPQLEEPPRMQLPAHERYPQVLRLLAEVQADQSLTLAEELRALEGRLDAGTVVLAFVSCEDPELPSAVRALRDRRVGVWPVLYHGMEPLGQKQSSQRPDAAREDYVYALQRARARPTILNLPWGKT